MPNVDDRFDDDQYVEDGGYESQEEDDDQPEGEDGEFELDDMREYIYGVRAFQNAVAMMAAVLTLLSSKRRRNTLKYIRKKRIYMRTVNRIRTQFGFHNFYFFVDQVHDYDWNRN